MSRTGLRRTLEPSEGHSIRNNWHVAGSNTVALTARSWPPHCLRPRSQAAGGQSRPAESSTIMAKFTNNYLVCVMNADTRRALKLAALECTFPLTSSLPDSCELAELRARELQANAISKGFDCTVAAWQPLPMRHYPLVGSPSDEHRSRIKIGEAA